MSEMSIYRSSGLSRPRRAVSRELDRLEARGQIQSAAIEQQADLQVARVQAIGYVGKHAMHEVALLSQLEQQLSDLVPAAAGRLHGLDDIAALAMADVLSDTVRRVR